MSAATLPVAVVRERRRGRRLRNLGVLLGCALGLAVFALCFLLPGDVFLRAAAAQAAGPVVTLGVFALALRRKDSE